MSESAELRLDCKPIGRSGKATLTAHFPDGTTFTDKIDLTRLSAREKFLDALCDGREAIDRSEVRALLEKLAADLGSDDADGSDDSDDTVSGRLVHLAKERYRLGRTPAGDPFAVALEGLQVARMIRGGSQSFRAELARDYWRKYDRVANSSALADALLVLQGEASEAVPEPVHLRVAKHEDSVVLDLGDTTGRVAVVTPEGWKVCDESPVLFRRTELTGALPEPQRGGNIEDLREFLNVDDESWQLVVGYEVGALLPDIKSLVEGCISGVSQRQV